MSPDPNYCVIQERRITALEDKLYTLSYELKMLKMLNPNLRR